MKIEVPTGGKYLNEYSRKVQTGGDVDVDGDGDGGKGRRLEDVLGVLGVVWCVWVGKEWCVWVRGVGEWEE